MMYIYTLSFRECVYILPSAPGFGVGMKENVHGEKTAVNISPEAGGDLA
jgi:hypothetical protein